MTSIPSLPSLEVRAYHRSTYNYDTKISTNHEINYVRFSLTVSTEEEAKAIAASFPKSCKVLGFKYKYAPFTSEVSCSINLAPDGVNKGINESGLARAKKIFSRINPIFPRSDVGNEATEEAIREFLK